MWMVDFSDYYIADSEMALKEWEKWKGKGEDAAKGSFSKVGWKMLFSLYTFWQWMQVHLLSHTLGNKSWKMCKEESIWKQVLSLRNLCTLNISRDASKSKTLHTKTTFFLYETFNFFSLDVHVTRFCVWVRAAIVWIMHACGLLCRNPVLSSLVPPSRRGHDIGVGKLCR